MTQTSTTTCQQCGGSLPPRNVWEANRQHAGECDGSIDSRTGRCRAYLADELWLAQSEEGTAPLPQWVVQMASDGRALQADLADGPRRPHLHAWTDIVVRASNGAAAMSAAARAYARRQP